LPCLPFFLSFGRRGTGGSRRRRLALEREEGFKLQCEINSAFKPTQPIAFLAPEKKAV
jgi:hypothetical protein